MLLETKPIRLTDRISFDGGAFYYEYRRPKGVRRKLGPMCPSLAVMLRKYHPGALEAFDEYEQRATSRRRSRLYSAMRIRADKSSLSSMSSAEFTVLWDRANGRCELTGIPFSYERHGTCVKRPWSPSVDRIDNAKGYEFENCRMVCTAVNLALNEFGDAVLRRIAEALVASIKQ